MPQTLLKAVRLIANRADQDLKQLDKNGRTVQQVLIELYNLRLKDFNLRQRWPWGSKTSSLQTVANYEAGTISVTNGSRTVTGSSTSFTSAMAGRYLKLNRDTELYEIASVTNGTTLVLRQPYIGDTGSSLTYLIWKKYYDLPPDCLMNSDLTVWKYPYKNNAIKYSEINRNFLNAQYTGFPAFWSWARINRTSETYSTGSVSTTKNSRVLTGSGTSWIGNVYEGSKITVGTETYNIDTIDSDTQITMVQNANATVSGSAYTIETGNRSQIIFSSTPDPVQNLEITYCKQFYDLSNDNDVSDIWEGFEHIVNNAVYGEYLDKLTSERAFAWLSIYEGQVKEAWNRICNMDPVEYAAVPARNSVSSNYRAGLYS